MHMVKDTAWNSTCPTPFLEVQWPSQEVRRISSDDAEIEIHTRLRKKTLESFKDDASCIA
jgi:hypothetical protein